jgi:hypothetical protein
VPGAGERIVPVLSLRLGLVDFDDEHAFLYPRQKLTWHSESSVVDPRLSRCQHAYRLGLLGCAIPCLGLALSARLDSVLQSALTLHLT